MRPLDPRLLRLSRATRRHLATATALGLAGAALVLIQAILLAHIVAAAFLRGAGLGALAPAMAGLMAAVAGRAAVAWAAEVTAHASSATVISDLRRRLLDHILRLGPSYLDGERTGELAALATRGVDALDAYLAGYLPNLVLAAVVPVGLLLWILPTDPLSFVILGATAPLIPLFGALIGRAAARATRSRWQALSVLSAHFLDVLQGLTTLRVFGRSGAQRETIREVSDRFRRTTMETLRIAFLSSLALEMTATIGTALVAVAIGLRLVDGRMGFEQGLAVLILAPEVYLPLRRAGAQFHASTEGLAAVERLFEVLQTEPALAGTSPAPDPAAAPIRFEDVGFERDERAGAVLSGASFRIAPGERVALVGESGAGKTTIASLLLGLERPTAGRITVGGVDLATVDPVAWRRRVAWMPQRPHLFAGSVADNIRLGRHEATDDQVRDAARRAGALAFIDALPGGLAADVGEHGARLSAGQRARLALARAFLRDAPLLILDEPTANLDAESEALVRAALEALPAGRTVLVIAHRTALTAAADRTLRLSGGRVVDAEDSPAERPAGIAVVAR